MTLSLKPIKPKRISDQVFEQIRELIFRGHLKPGERLMPERELSEALGVSRTTVRNAIQKLEVLGLLEHRQGQGTFIRSLGEHADNPLAVAMEENKDATVIDLLEVRKGLECNAAAFAAQRREDKDLTFMESSIEEMRTEVGSGRLGTEADVSFHMAIAYATKNPVHVYIMKNFYDFLFHGINENLYHLYSNPDNIEKILYQHRQIFQSIRDRNPERSFAAMEIHILFVLDFFKSIRG